MMRPFSPSYGQKDAVFLAITTFTIVLLACFIALHQDHQAYSAYCQAANHAEEEACKLDKPFIEKLIGDPAAFFTAILAILTLVLSAVGVDQVWFLFRADETARRSAEAALKSANVAVAQSRPWISYNKIAIGGNLLLRSSTTIATIDFTIKNYGSIPANDVVIFGNIVHDDAEKGVAQVNHTADDIRRNPVYIGKSLFPGDEIIVHCHFMGDMSKAISAVDYYGDHIPFIIVGRIDYKSTLVSESHFTTFTLQIGRRDEAAGINPYDGEIGRDILFVTEWFRGPIAT